MSILGVFRDDFFDSILVISSFVLPITFLFNLIIDYPFNFEDILLPDITAKLEVSLLFKTNFKFIGSCTQNFFLEKVNDLILNDCFLKNILDWVHLNKNDNFAHILGKIPNGFVRTKHFNDLSIISKCSDISELKNMNLNNVLMYLISKSIFNYDYIQ